MKLIVSAIDLNTNTLIIFIPRDSDLTIKFEVLKNKTIIIFTAKWHTMTYQKNGLKKMAK